MAFDQGLSGLNAAAIDLDVIGNNVANSRTVGFKPSRTSRFAVYAKSLDSSGASPVGIGTSTKVYQQWLQGTISSNGNPLNTAINGNGFYQVSTNGAIAYTRNGEFKLDPSGAVITPSGANLQGYLASGNGVINRGIVTNLVVNTASLPPNPTSVINTLLNLDSGSPVLPIANFNPTNSTTYSYSTAVPIYDSLGNSHALQTYYLNKGIVNGEAQWAVFATLDGTLVGGAPATPVATFSFTGNGALNPATTQPVTTPPFNVPINITLNNGATSPQTFTMNYTGTTQFGSSSGVNAVSQNGFSSGELQSFSAGEDGVLTGTYTNKQTQALGQIILVSFVNPGGLQPIGNNLYLPTSAVGTPLIGVPGSGNLGVLQSSAVENSATDLTAELVNMILAQQDYQANAQTVKAANQISQTLVNIRN